MDASIIQGTEAEFRRYGGDIWICATCGTDAIVRLDAGRLVIRCRACKNWGMAPREK